MIWRIGDLKILQFIHWTNLLFCSVRLEDGRFPDLLCLRRPTQHWMFWKVHWGEEKNTASSNPPAELHTAWKTKRNASRHRQYEKLVKHGKTLNVQKDDSKIKNSKNKFKKTWRPKTKKKLKLLKIKTKEIPTCRREFRRQWRVALSLLQCHFWFFVLVAPCMKNSLATVLQTII